MQIDPLPLAGVAERDRDLPLHDVPGLAQGPDGQDPPPESRLPFQVREKGPHPIDGCVHLRGRMDPHLGPSTRAPSRTFPGAHTGGRNARQDQHFCALSPTFAPHRAHRRCCGIAERARSIRRSPSFPVRSPPTPVRAPQNRESGKIQSVGNTSVWNPSIAKNPPTRLPTKPIEPMMLNRPATAPRPTTAKLRAMISTSKNVGKRIWRTKWITTEMRRQSPKAAMIVMTNAERGFLTVTMAFPRRESGTSSGGLEDTALIFNLGHSDPPPLRLEIPATSTICRTGSWITKSTYPLTLHVRAGC